MASDDVCKIIRILNPEVYMPNPFIVAKTEADFIIFMGNLHKKVGIHGLTCDLTPLEISNCQADTLTLLFNHQVLLPAMRNYSKETNNFVRHSLSGTGVEDLNPPPGPVFDNVPAARPPGALNRVITTLGRMKLSAGFNDNIAADLLLIAAVTSIVEHLAPSFSLELITGPNNTIVRIKFKKYRHKSVYIQWRLFGGEWAFLAIDDASPHLDDRPLQNSKLPETREYRMRFYDGGEANGEWSEIKNITIIP
jgi:hypothetical protein